MKWWFHCILLVAIVLEASLSCSYAATLEELGTNDDGTIKTPDKPQQKSPKQVIRRTVKVRESLPPPLAALPAPNENNGPIIGDTNIENTGATNNVDIKPDISIQMPTTTEKADDQVPVDTLPKNIKSNNKKVNHVEYKPRRRGNKRPTETPVEQVVNSSKDSTSEPTEVPIALEQVEQNVIPVVVQPALEDAKKEQEETKSPPVAVILPHLEVPNQRIAIPVQQQKQQQQPTLAVIDPNTLAAIINNANKQPVVQQKQPVQFVSLAPKNLVADESSNQINGHIDASQNQLNNLLDGSYNQVNNIQNGSTNVLNNIASGFNKQKATVLSDFGNSEITHLSGFGNKKVTKIEAGDKKENDEAEKPKKKNKQKQKQKKRGEPHRRHHHHHRHHGPKDGVRFESFGKNASPMVQVNINRDDLMGAAQPGFIRAPTLPMFGGSSLPQPVIVPIMGNAGLLNLTDSSTDSLREMLAHDLNGNTTNLSQAQYVLVQKFPSQHPADQSPVFRATPVMWQPNQVAMMPPAGPLPIMGPLPFPFSMPLPMPLAFGPGPMPFAAGPLPMQMPVQVPMQMPFVHGPSPSEVIKRQQQAAAMYPYSAQAAPVVQQEPEPVLESKPSVESHEPATQHAASLLKSISKLVEPAAAALSAVAQRAPASPQEAVAIPIQQVTEPQQLQAPLPLPSQQQDDDDEDEGVIWQYMPVMKKKPAAATTAGTQAPAAQVPAPMQVPVQLPTPASTRP